MTIESFFIGTRLEGKRYGPQSKDMQVSEFITLLNPREEPVQFVLPDFSGLARHLDEEIRKHFKQQEEDEYYRHYRVLSDIWYQAGSLSNEANRSRRYERVMDESLKFLVYSHDVMPKINPNNLKFNDTTQASSKGKMYCVALLFHIIARAAYEPESLGADPTLRTHCQWMKNWIKTTLGENFLGRMMINYALYTPEEFPALQRLSGEEEIRDVDTFLANAVRNARRKTEEDLYNNNYQLKLQYTRFFSEQFDFLHEMRDIHYRIDRIEQLLDDLISHQVVDFSKADDAGEWIKEQVCLLESNDTKLLPSDL